jgi:hypothetical protein
MGASCPALAQPAAAKALMRSFLAAHDEEKLLP